MSHPSYPSYPSYPPRLRRFARKKVRVAGLPRPMAWLAGFWSAGRLQEGCAPYAASLEGHYLTFAAGEAIRFGELFSPLQEALAKVEAEILRLQAAPQSLPADTLAEAARTQRESAARQAQLAQYTVQQAQLRHLLDQVETILQERAARAEGICRARMAAYCSGASRRLRRAVPTPEVPLPDRWLRIRTHYENPEKGVL